MKIVVVLLVTLVTVIQSQAAMVHCKNENESLFFNADLSNKELLVTDLVNRKIVWGDDITSVKYLPGFQTNPPQIRVTINLKKLGVIEGMIFDRVKIDQNWKYKDMRGTYYLGQNSGHEKYPLACYFIMD
jgi:hypothetical protein